MPLANLNILQCQVFSLRTSMGLECGLLSGYENEKIPDGIDHGVHVQINMIRPDGFSEVFSSLLGFLAGILGAHKTSVEDAACKFLGRFWHPSGALGFPSDPADIFDNLFLCNQYSSSATIIMERSAKNLPPFSHASTTSLHMECTIVAVAQLSIPPLNGKKNPETPPHLLK